MRRYNCICGPFLLLLLLEMVHAEVIQIPTQERNIQTQEERKSVQSIFMQQVDSEMGATTAWSIDFDKAIEYAINQSVSKNRAPCQATIGHIVAHSEIDTEFLEHICQAVKLDEPMMWKGLYNIYLQLRRVQGEKVFSNHLYDLNPVLDLYRKDYYTPLVFSTRFWSNPTETYYYGGGRRSVKRLLFLDQGLKEHGTPGDTLLDIGCNTGLFLYFFEKRGFVTTGIENGNQLEKDRKANVTIHSVTETLSQIYKSSTEFVYDDYLGYLKRTGRTFDHIFYLSVWHHHLLELGYGSVKSKEPMKILHFILDITDKSFYFDYGQEYKHVNMPIQQVIQQIRGRNDIENIELHQKSLEDGEKRDLLVVSKMRKQHS